MIEINKTEIINTVEALSTAEHFYATPGSASEAVDVSRPPLLTSSKSGLLNLWIEDACCDLIARLIGWASAATYNGSRLTLVMREENEKRDKLLRHVMLRLISLDVWRRAVGCSDSEAAARATMRLEAAEDRMLSIML